MGQRQFGPVGTFSGTRQAHRDSQVWGFQFRLIKEQSELGWLGVFVCHTTDGRREDGASIG